MIKQIITHTLATVSFLSGSLAAKNSWNFDYQMVRDQINQKIMSVEADTPEVFKVDTLAVNRSERVTPLRIYLFSLRSLCHCVSALNLLQNTIIPTHCYFPVGGLRHASLCVELNFEKNLMLKGIDEVLNETCSF
jgi:hypothetical protein